MGGNDKDCIVVEHDIIEKQQLQTSSAINDGLFSEDDSLFNLNEQNYTDATLESQEDPKLVGHEASSDYRVWDTILSTKLTNISHTVQQVSTHVSQSPPDFQLYISSLVIKDNLADHSRLST